jgi:hypothetical protein
LSNLSTGFELLNYLFQAGFQFLHLRAEADPAVIFVSAVATAVARIYLKKHPGDDDYLFF